MKSATAVSYELDDVTAAAAELTEQIKDKLTFAKNTVAILHGQPDMEIGALSAEISRELGCHVIGGTTAAGAVLTNDGYHELAVVLHVLTDDECLFAAAMSRSMSDAPQKAQKEIADTYSSALGALKAQNPDAEPNLVISVGAVLPNYSSDNCLADLSRECGNLPVFGYIAGDDFEFCKQQVFLDGEAGGDRMAVLLISGGLKPIFQVANLAGKQVLDKRLVTKSKGNVIYEVDDKPVYEYIKTFPFIDEQTDSLFNYQFFVEDKGENDGVTVSRALNSYNRETGEVTCFADVPQGAYIGLLYCDGKDVALTTEAALNGFLEKLNGAKTAGGYEYSTALVATCSLRNLFLAAQNDVEGKLISDLIPSGLTLSGLYAFGEIAPTGIRGSRAVNRFHNATFTMCAF